MQSDENSVPLMTAGGLSAGVGTKAYLDLTRSNNLLNNWDKSTNELISGVKEWKSPVTGNMLKASPVDAERLLTAYTSGASDLASSRILGVRSGDVMKLQSIPDIVAGSDRKLLSDAFRLGGNNTVSQGVAHGLSQSGDAAFQNAKGLRQHYGAFAGDAAKSTLSTHMIDVMKNSTRLPDSWGGYVRDVANSLPDAVRDIFHDGALSVPDKYTKVVDYAKQTGRKDILEFFERVMLGEANSPHPGIGQFVSGGRAGTGIRDAYSHGLKPVVKFLRRGSLGLAAGGVGLGALGALKSVINAKQDPFQYIPKQASTVDDSVNTKELFGGSALTALGGVTGVDRLRNLINAIRNPNRNVGFTFGDWSQIGAGHRTPANNIRTVLQDAVDALPAGDKNKKIEFSNMRRIAAGVERENAGKQYNMLYNTGMGAANPTANGWDAAVYDKLQGNIVRKPQSMRRYMTDLQTEDYAGATQWDSGIAGKKVKDNKFLAYGSSDPLDYPEAVRKDILHLGDVHGGSPFIDPKYVDNLRELDTRDKLFTRLKEYAVGKREGLTPEARANVLDILNRVEQGQKLVTIAGSSRGDYMTERLIPSLESADRHGLGKGKVVFAPLMANYALDDPTATVEVGNAFRRMDPSGRVVPLGKLQGDVYAGLQRLADINMASTGTMAISEAANNGNLNVIPRYWNDGDEVVNRMHAKSDMIRGVSGHVTQPAWVQLDNWNAGNKFNMLDGNRTQSPNPSFMATVDQMNDASAGGQRSYFDRLVKQFKPGYEGALQHGDVNGLFNHTRGANFNPDNVMELLSNPSKLSEAQLAAAESATSNLGKIEGAHKVLADDMFKTVNKNVFKQRLGAAGRMLGPLGLLGTGGLMVHDALKPVSELSKSLGKAPAPVAKLTDAIASTPTPRIRSTMDRLHDTLSSVAAKFS